MLKNFKAIITTNKDAQVGQNQQKAVVNLPFELEITIDKNNQIHDIDSQLDQLSNLSNLFKTYDRWANRVNGWFSRDGNNDINRSLQPVIFYGLGNEMRKLGNTKYDCLL